MNVNAGLVRIVRWAGYAAVGTDAVLDKKYSAAIDRSLFPRTMLQGARISNGATWVGIWRVRQTEDQRSLEATEQG